MRKITYLVIAFALSVLLLSCKKEHTQKTDMQTISVTISANDEYSFHLGGFGDEEGASINLQALHYQVSSLERVNYGDVTYHYTPAANYIGTDEVELKSARGSDGGSENTDILLTTIKFTIVTR